jgi:hypothetical protein
VKAYFYLFLIAVALFIFGCGGGGSGNSSGNSPSQSTFTGNWAIEAHDPNDSGEIIFGAYLTVHEQAVSGSISPIPFARCFNSPPPVAGIQGTLSGVALNLTSPVTLITATTNSSDTVFGGSYQLLVSGCMYPGNVTGTQVPSLQGNWASSFSSSNGTLTVSAVLTRGNLDQQGFPSLGGQVTIQGSPCFTTGQLTADQRGLYIGGPGLPGGADAGSGFVDVGGGVAIVMYDAVMGGPGGTRDLSGNSVDVDYLVVGGACNGDGGSGTLTRQP